jgi:sporulation protein YlmC with PRC-barrel domain
MKKLFPTLLLLLTFFSVGACTSPPSPRAAVSANMMGYTIENQDGDNLGVVKGVILDLESGQIRYVIMEPPPDISTYNKAAFVPSGTNHTAVPWEALQVESGTTDLVLIVEDRIVHEAPRLIDDLDTLTENWDTRIQTYWQTKLP